MKKLQWKTELAVGVEEIDNQHRELIAHTNALLDSVAEGTSEGEILNLLGFLKRYINEHFSTEEKIMNENLDMDSEYVKHHLAEHTAFNRDIVELTKDIDEWKANSEHIDEFSHWLANWYLNHIMNTDKQLGELLKRA